MSLADWVYIANDVDVETTLKTFLRAADSYDLRYDEDDPHHPVRAFVGSYFTCLPFKRIRRNPWYWGDIFGMGSTDLHLGFLDYTLLDAAGELIIKLICDVCQKTDWDIAWFYLGDFHVPSRINGQVILDNPPREIFWTPERLQLVNIEYKMGNEREYLNTGSIHYQIRVAADADEETVLKTLMRSAGDYELYPRQDNPRLPAFANVGSLFTCDALQYTGGQKLDPVWGDIFRDYIDMSLIFFKDADANTTHDLLVRLLMDVCQRTDWHIHWRTSISAKRRLILRRINGKLVLNNHTGIWTPERLQMISIKYRMDSGEVESVPFVRRFLNRLRLWQRRRHWDGHGMKP